MNRRSLPLSVVALVAAVAIVAAACGTPGPEITKVDAGTAVGMLGTRTVIDVRTPAEFAAGHIAGAQNIDIEGPDFATRIAALNKAGDYLVYCQSGRRSAIAATRMADAGFSDVVDAGGLQALVDAGAALE